MFGLRAILLMLKDTPRIQNPIVTYIVDCIHTTFREISQKFYNFTSDFGFLYCTHDDNRMIETRSV
jgi:hypothetical protein